MSLDKEKFDLFIEKSKELPNIFSLKIHNKIAQFLDGVMPELTPDECVSIKNYLPHQVWSKFNQLTDEVINEINWNVTNIPSERQIRTYLEYLTGVLSPITSSLKTATWFEEIEKMDPNFTANFANRLEQNQIAPFNLLRDLLWSSNRRYYAMYNKVELFVDGLLITKGGVTTTHNKKGPLNAYFEELNNIDKKINDKQSSDDANSRIAQSGHIPKTLKSLFKSADTYDHLIEFMAIEKLISKGEKGIIWKGLKANRKFEIAAFYEALFLNGFFIGNERVPDKELCRIASNTFFDFNVSYKTIGNKAYNSFTDNYKEILVRFTQFQNKAS